MTVGDLTKSAGVSRTTFYELFEDKEACFLAAYDAAVETLVRRVVRAYESEQGWPARLADELVAGRAEQLPGLLSDALFATLVPYIGPDAAAREVDKLTR